MTINSKLFGGALALFLAAFGSTAFAQHVWYGGKEATPAQLKFDPSVTYVAVFGKNFAPNKKFKPRFVVGVFCPLNSANATQCENSDAIVVGAKKSHYMATGKPNMFFTVQKVAANVKGKHALVGGMETATRALGVDGATFAFTPRPGSVVVIGPRGFNSASSIAMAKDFMAKYFDPQFNSARYSAMPAYAADCTTKKSAFKRSTDCKLGKQIDPSVVR